MRPRKLVLENFGPYRERTEIDFGRLGPFFLVWGKTGSGKTSIFDAMTYALYGAAPGSRGGLERQLCSHYAKAGEKPTVEFEFDLGEAAYRVVRSPPYLRLNRRGEEAEAPPQAALWRKESDAWAPVADRLSEVVAEIRSRIGLSADEFSKIILLPQGEFQRFLDMDSTQRVEILEKLFPVSLHDAATEKAREKAKFAREDLTRLDSEISRARAEAFEGVAATPKTSAAGAATTTASASVASGTAPSAEALAGPAHTPDASDLALEGLRLAEAEATARLAREEALAAIQRTSADLRRGEETRARAANAAEAGERLGVLEAKSPIAKKDSERAARARRALSAIPPVDAHDRVLRSFREASTERDAGREALAGLESRRAEIEALGARALALSAEVENLDRERGELEIAALAWNGVQAAEENLARAMRATRIARSASQAATDALAAAREAKAATFLPPEEEEAIRAGYALAKETHEAAGRIAKKAEELERRKREALLSLRNREGAEAALEPLERSLAIAEATRSRDAAVRLAMDLVPGEPCPVCGSREHPAPLSTRMALPEHAFGMLAPAVPPSVVGDAASVFVAVGAPDTDQAEDSMGVATAAEAEIALLRSERDRVMRAASEARARVEADERAITDAQTALRSEIVLAESSMSLELSADSGILAPPDAAAIRAVPVLPESADRETLDISLPTYAEAKAALLCAQEKIGKAAVPFRELESRKAKAAAASIAYEKAAEALTAAETRRGAANVDFARAEAECEAARAHSGGGDPGPRLAAAIKRRGEAEAERKKALESVQAWTRERDRAEALLRVAEFRLPALETQVEGAMAEVSAAISAAGFANAREAREAFVEAAQLAALEEAVADYDRRLAAARAAFAEADRARGSESVPDLAALQSALSAARDAFDEAQVASDRARSARERAERLAARLATLEAERRALAERSAGLASLAALLCGEIPGRRLPFKNYVLGRSFREVAALASYRLSEMSDGRYGLVADEGASGRGRIGLELLVRDAHTGRTRPAGTLSGGERFMTAVSLALGLADAIRSRSGGAALDAIFIDEGFGSLDEEALDLAIGALDRARGGRIIGIVSHVAELRNRIPSRIEVTKGRGGSSVEII